MFRVFVSCFLILSTIIYGVIESNNANKIVKENCIEIYLYKEFITPEKNIELKKSEYYRANKNGKLKNLDENYLNRLAFDTIENKITVKHEGFKNKMNLIESTPFIKNSEIQFFENTKKELNTALVINKKNKTDGNINDYWDNHLKQFVILVNKKPILNGYLYCPMASSICENTNILSYETKRLLLLNFSNRKITNINLKKDYPELYRAFKNSNRLIE